MKKYSILRNIAAVIAGVLVGSAINMSLINISGSIIPPPAGADVTTPEGLKAVIHLFEFKHYIFPFLAHAFGTFMGAIIAAFVATTHKMKFALGIGAFFFIGGIAACFMIPATVPFMIVDLTLAYFPMAYLGGKLASHRK